MVEMSNIVLFSFTQENKYKYNSSRFQKIISNQNHYNLVVSCFYASASGKCQKESSEKDNDMIVRSVHMSKQIHHLTHLQYVGPHALYCVCTSTLSGKEAEIQLQKQIQYITKLGMY